MTKERIRLYVLPSDGKKTKEKHYFDAETDKITDLICEETTNIPIMILYKDKWYEIYDVSKEKLLKHCKHLTL